MHSAAFARYLPPIAVGRTIKTENVMKSGQGRLILRDGTDLPIAYRLVHNEYGSWCSGTLIGDIRSVDPGSFSQGMRAELEDESDIVLLVTA